MSKFRGAGKKRAEEPNRADTGSSIRGKTISQPIPFPDDDEFPIRTPGAGIALPLGADGIERPLDSRASEHDNYFNQPGVAISDYGALDSGNPQMPRDSPPPPPEAQNVRNAQNQSPNQGNVLRDSMISVPDAPSAEKPQRKKSSMRSVFGKLFGRKRKGSPSGGKGDKRSSVVRAEQHRSDPTALNKIQSATGTQKRSASLPIDEFNRALRSHSVIADSFPLYNNYEHEHDPNRESMQTDTQGRPRRATTPSRLWTPNKIQGYADWTGLSPRPASSQARGSKALSDAEAQDAIGTAVTKSAQQNRRSRSVGELQAAAKSSGIGRRRSDDIRYWRESYDPGLMSPMSSNKAETEEHVQAEPEDVLIDAPQEQPQPFNFGPMGEMAGMKITQAASLETRVQRLEETVTKMGRSVSRIRHDGPLQLQDPPRRNSARIRSFSRPRNENSELSLPPRSRHPDSQSQASLNRSTRGSQRRSASYDSTRPSTTSTRGSEHQGDMLPLPSAMSKETSLSISQKIGRPLSTSTTIRGIPSSSPTMPVESLLNGEHYNALINMILAEQAARKHLEAVVHSLQRQLQAVLTGTTAAYSAPDPNTTGEFQHERNTAHGYHSSFEQDDSSDDEGRYVPEDFQTPNEVSNKFGDEIFGDVDSKLGDRKTAPRTLSLSQITLGRDIQPSLNF